ncbi:uncharacterized protein LOC105202125 [Solenopsis invicta]|uniref:uncharacterized protein LOC105202125 n=1 Tax=Solenopsis invicta TaxID=13686 RepID=UPI000595FCEB|nr:uncharacterized protein LOC105202125 [Solenopsis invicta]
MVPTVAEFPTAETSVNLRTRRQRSPNDTKWERYALSPEDYRRFVMQSRKDLSSSTVRTIILVNRNRIHQKRSNALWVERRRILRSRTINPENQQQESQVSSHSEDSSSTEKGIISALSSPRIIAPRFIVPQPYRDDDKFAIRATLAKIQGWMGEININNEAGVCAG